MNVNQLTQPPSGGCVLKHLKGYNKEGKPLPAAFRRLCVETILEFDGLLTQIPAAFRRLCVETHPWCSHQPKGWPSRLQAAVC